MSPRNSLRPQKRLRRWWFVALLGTLSCFAAPIAFIAGISQPTQQRWKVPHGRIAMRYEGETEARMPLVVPDKSNIILTASVVPTALGFLFFPTNLWFGVALFVAGAWVSRQNNDFSLGVRALSEAALTAVNFGGDLLNRYKTNDKMSDAFSDAINKAGNRPAAEKFSGVIEEFSRTIKDIDDEVSIRNTVGSTLSKASELANESVDTIISTGMETTASLKQKVDDFFPK